MAKYWVTMTDKFMSGWGGAQGRVSKFVVACDSYVEADRVKCAAERRPEMKYVNVRVTKPHYDAARYVTTERAYADLGPVWKG